ncbi:tyrosine-protein kinase Fer isoform X2 [Nematostella vectensis]|uniref:tyrosine-protein kinase Fer isoform X2 n=1 Tax=Nematostella vectensis TaxID=45351 RepID=UPI0020772A6A|nr:tyrosine-protein kinase Fer isoform X2 [Nematostella vectensis]
MKAKACEGFNRGFTRADTGKKAWSVYISESEAKSRLVSQFSNQVSSITFPKLEQLIQDKKNLLRKYRTERFRVDSEYKQESDEIDRLRRTYRDNAKDAENAQKRYEEVITKDKMNAKEWDKSKDKFIKMALKLHQNHNDYVLSLVSANCHQEFYHNSVVPTMLEHLQELQESYINEWKEILQEILNFTDCCREEFVTSSIKVHESIGAVTKEHEYVDFIQANKKSSPVCPFLFEPTLLENTSTNLKANKLMVNDLTGEKLQHKNTLLTQELQIIDQQLEHKIRDLKIEKDNLETAKSDGRETLCILPREVTVAVLEWQLEELQCSKLKLERKISTVKEVLDSLGNDPPPKFYDLISPPVSLSGDYSTKDYGPSETRRSTRIPRISVANLFHKRIKKKSSSDSDNKSDLDGHDEDEDEDSVGDYVEPPEDIPLQDEPWFHGIIQRKDVDKRLKSDGEYLVRESATKPGQFVLSARSDGALRHFIIQTMEDGFVRFEEQAFPCIRELLKYHITHHIPVTKKSNAMISTPVQRPPKDKWEISHSIVEIESKLGHGHFGDVMRGYLKPSHLPVAVKSCKEDVSEVVKKKFLAEAEILKQYDHPNIVRLIGVCAEREPVYIVMELMLGGDFLTYLRKHLGKIQVPRLVKFSIHAAAGMEYLASKNCIHRDLAARNCLIGEDDVLKISDFGMSREVYDEGLYEASNMREIPVKWTAPEALNYAQYTTLSDIWSFGVLLWETFSFGNTPYPGLNNKETRDKVEQGYRMPPPMGTPPTIYQIMKDCWNIDPEARPKFDELLRRLKQVKEQVGASLP